MDVERADKIIGRIMRQIWILFIDYFYNFFKHIRMALICFIMFVLTLAYAFIPLPFFDTSRYKFKDWERKLF